jgi:hypothetical protein
VLLLDLIRQQNFAAFFLEDQKDDGAGYRREQKHIGEDEHDIVNVIWLVVLDRQHLVVRIGIVGGSHVDVEDHLHQITVIRPERVDVHRKIRVFIVGVEFKRPVAQQSVEDYDGGKEDEIDEDVHIGGGERDQRFSNLGVKDEGED